MQKQEKVIIFKEGLTIDEAAAYAGVSRKTIDAMLISGCIPSISVGVKSGKTIILRTELQQFLEDAQGLTISNDIEMMNGVAEIVRQRRLTGWKFQI